MRKQQLAVADKLLVVRQHVVAFRTDRRTIARQILREKGQIFSRHLPIAVVVSTDVVIAVGDRERDQVYCERLIRTCEVGADRRKKHHAVLSSGADGGADDLAVVGNVFGGEDGPAGAVEQTIVHLEALTAAPLNSGERPIESLVPASTILAG